MYDIGVEDNGTPAGLDAEEMEESLRILLYIAHTHSAQTRVVYIKKGLEGFICKLKITSESHRALFV